MISTGSMTRSASPSRSRRTGFGARGRDQRQALAHQQRVAEQLAQPGERVAHPGLAQPDPFGRPGDAALGQERVERYEKVEIDARETHLSLLAGFIAISNDLHSQAPIAEC